MQIVFGLQLGIGVDADFALSDVAFIDFGSLCHQMRLLRSKVIVTDLNKSESPSKRIKRIATADIHRGVRVTYTLEHDLCFICHLLFASNDNSQTTVRDMTFSRNGLSLFSRASGCIQS